MKKLIFFASCILLFQDIQAGDNPEFNNPHSTTQKPIVKLRITCTNSRSQPGVQALEQPLQQTANESPNASQKKITIKLVQRVPIPFQESSTATTSQELFTEESSSEDESFKFQRGQGGKRKRSDYEESSEDSQKSQTQAHPKKKAISAPPHLPIYDDIAGEVIRKDYNSREELAKAHNLSLDTLNYYLKNMRFLGLLTSDNTRYINPHNSFPQIAEAIKNRDSFEKILEEFNLQDRHSLFTIVAELYKQELLTLNDTEYLKDEKGVVGRWGETKGRMLLFFQSAYNGEPTRTLGDLCKQFNESTHRPNRDITESTFKGHYEELKKKGSLSSEIIEFYDRCNIRNKRCKPRNKWS